MVDRLGDLRKVLIKRGMLLIISSWRRSRQMTLNLPLTTRAQRKANCLVTNFPIDLFVHLDSLRPRRRFIKTHSKRLKHFRQNHFGWEGEWEVAETRWFFVGCNWSEAEQRRVFLARFFTVFSDYFFQKLFHRSRMLSKNFKKAFLSSNRKFRIFGMDLLQNSNPQRKIIRLISSSVSKKWFFSISESRRISQKMFELGISDNSRFCSRTSISRKLEPTSFSVILTVRKQSKIFWSRKW